MTIAVDLRSIQRGTFSGVENYTLSLLERMIAADRDNKYLLFYNGLRPVQPEDLRFLNTTVVSRRWPNKLLAATIVFTKRPDFAKFLGNFDTLFLPNLNHVTLAKGRKLVVTVHDLSPAVLPECYDLRRRLWHWSVGFARTLRRADKIIAVSRYTKHELMVQLGLPEEKIVVVHQGVDHGRFHPGIEREEMRRVRNLYGLPGEFILYVGTLEPRKNVTGLLRAWENLRQSVPLVIAGKPGWKYEKIFQLARQSRRSHLVHFLGFVSEADKPALLRLASMLVFPSVYEGFGLPVLEAQACGTPVVTSSLTSLPEVAGNAALLVNPYDLDSLGLAMTSLLEDENLRQSLREKGLTRASSFTWDKTAAGTLRVLSHG